MEKLNVAEPAHFVSMDSEQFVKEATAIVDNAQSRKICLRILGALAIYIHSHDSEFIKLYLDLARNGDGNPMFTDLDLIAYKKQSRDVTKLLQDLSFKADNMVNWWFGDRMMVYEHPESKLHVDVFFNNLEYSHDVRFGDKPGSGRLELDYPTITLEDLVLEKLQPHQMGRKDAVDLIILFLAHQVRKQSEKDSIDGGYIARILSDDWGFWYDSTMNLDKVKSLSTDLVTKGKLAASRSATLGATIDELRKLIDIEPKTKNWNKRAKTGINKPWYRQVEELMSN